MRILDDKNLSVLWSWGSAELNEFNTRFKTCLFELLKIFEAQDSIPPEEIKELAQELEEAGLLLDQASSNCLALAKTLRTMAGEQVNDDFPPRLAGSEKSAVALLRTTLTELRGKMVELDSFENGRAIIRAGEDYYATPLDRMLILPKELLNEK